MPEGSKGVVRLARVCTALKTRPVVRNAQDDARELTIARAGACQGRRNMAVSRSNDLPGRLNEVGLNLHFITERVTLLECLSLIRLSETPA
jgi:hypothetical protein